MLETQLWKTIFTQQLKFHISEPRLVQATFPQQHILFTLQYASPQLTHVDLIYVHSHQAFQFTLKEKFVNIPWTLKCLVNFKSG